MLEDKVCCACVHVCVHMCAIPLSKACQAAMLSQGKEPVSTGRYNLRLRAAEERGSRCGGYAHTHLFYTDPSQQQLTVYSFNRDSWLSLSFFHSTPSLVPDLWKQEIETGTKASVSIFFCAFCLQISHDSRVSTSGLPLGEHTCRFWHGNKCCNMAQSVGQVLLCFLPDLNSVWLW